MDDLGTDALLTTTRAVRKRLNFNQAVGLDTICECLRIAVQAPTGGGEEQTSFVIIDRPDIKARLGEIFREATLPVFSEKYANADTRTAKRAYAGGIYLARNLERVPVLVLFCMDGRMTNEGNARFAGFYGSVVPTIWNFQLALRSRGLGSTYITGYLSREAEVASLLGIPYETVSQIALVPVAYTVGTRFRAAQRLPLAGRCFRNSWG